MDGSRLNISVFGAGSVGCYVGGRLAAGGAARVSFIGRARMQNALRENGLSLSHFALPPVHIAAAQFDFVTGPQGLSGADIVLVCVKSQDSAEAARVIAEHVPRGCLVISLQNGIFGAQTLTADLKAARADVRVLGAVVPFNVTPSGAGHFHSGTQGALLIETVSDDPKLAALLSALLAAFKAGGQDARAEADIGALQWGKLLINLNNAMNTLHGGTLKSGLMNRDYRLAFRGMIQEALPLLRRSHIEPQGFTGVSLAKFIRVLALPNWLYAIIMERIIKIDAAARSSMLDDLEGGRAPEIDYLQGEVVRLAVHHGLDPYEAAPMNLRMITAINEAFAAGASPNMSGAEIRIMLRGRG